MSKADINTPLPMPSISLFQAYKLRLKRRRLLWRSLRSRHQLACLQDYTARITPSDILCVTTLRNEALRLPFFLQHYRDLGVDHFLVVDNGSDDGSLDMLLGQPDVSVWQTEHSYRGSRFGVDWMTWLQLRYGHGHWVLTADVDELLIYDGCDQHGLTALTRVLDQQGQRAFGALMLDLYPKGAVGHQCYNAGQNPVEVLPYFDVGSYRAVRQAPMGNLWVQGGARERVFFANCPERSPTLNKIPLIKWNRRFAYVNSTHSALPRRLNAAYDGPDCNQPSGALLHTKFLPDIVSKSEIEKGRGQHFNHPQHFDHYYEQLSEAPDLWHTGSQRYTGPDGLVACGVMPKITWSST